MEGGVEFPFCENFEPGAFREITFLFWAYVILNFLDDWF